MNLYFTLKFVEPSFNVYYFDIVYSYPRVLEIDYLVILDGGLLLIELERGLKKASIKSLKYFVNGVCRRPVLYLSDGLKHTKCQVNEVGVPMLTLLDYSVVKSQIREFLESFKEDFLEKRKKERYDQFIIDNFLCAFLLYGSPMIFKILLESSNMLKHVTDSFELARHRVNLIRKVNLFENLRFDKESCDEESFKMSSEGSSSEPPSSIKSSIVIIPTIRSKYFKKEVSKFLKKSEVEDLFSKLENLVFVYTKESREDAHEIISSLSEIINCKVKSEEVEKQKIGDTVNQYVNIFQPDVLVLLVGEVPKKELIKLMDLPSHVRLAVVIWRPIICEKALEKLIEMKLEDDSVLDESCRGEIEKVELCMFEV